MTLIKTHSTPRGIIHRLCVDEYDVECQSISQARRLKILFDSRMVCLRNGNVEICSSLRGVFNREIVKAKVSKPLSKNNMSGSKLVIRPGFFVDFLALEISKDGRVNSLIPFTRLEDFVLQLK